MEKIDHLYKLHNKFIKTLLKVIERDNTKVVFVTGKDKKINQKIPLKFGKISFQEEYLFQSGGKQFLISPGDISDSYPHKLRWVSVNRFKYNFFIWLNKRINRYQINKGGYYYSLFHNFNIKRNSEELMYSFLSEYKEHLIEMSIHKDAAAIVCGHLNYPGVFHFAGITYLNPGYWSESLTALAETNAGLWKVLEYGKVMEEREEAKKLQLLQEALFKDQNIENYV